MGQGCVAKILIVFVGVIFAWWVVLELLEAAVPYVAPFLLDAGSG